MTDVTESGILTTARICYSAEAARVFLRSGCPQRRTAVEDLPRCGSHFRSNDVFVEASSTWQSTPELSIHVRTAAVASTWKKEMSDEYLVIVPI